MPQPTAHRYPDAWHNAEDAQEQAWLDDWIRGRICVVTLDVCPARQPSAAADPALTSTGSC
ncbi:hypothetical protein ACFC8N_43155 [Streptomyces sp. NPDC055966]|uniref:hypothetical protein n=1 Tax=Streptomyces sp. NPDC055966 TaxID=3345669 RepID=UPI0035DBDD9F